MKKWQGTNKYGTNREKNVVEIFEDENKLGIIKWKIYPKFLKIIFPKIPLSINYLWQNCVEIWSLVHKFCSIIISFINCTEYQLIYVKIRVRLTDVCLGIICSVMSWL